MSEVCTIDGIPVFNMTGSTAVDRQIFFAYCGGIDYTGTGGNPIAELNSTTTRVNVVFGEDRSDFAWMKTPIDGVDTIYLNKMFAGVGPRQAAYTLVHEPLHHSAVVDSQVDRITLESGLGGITDKGLRFSIGEMAIVKNALEELVIRARVADVALANGGLGGVFGEPGRTLNWPGAAAVLGSYLKNTIKGPSGDIFLSPEKISYIMELFGSKGQSYFVGSRVQECFPRDARVLVASGCTAPIGSVGLGDIVLSFDPCTSNGRGALVPRRVVRIYRNSTTEWIRLTWVEGGEHRELVATPGHHFLDQFGQFPTIAEMTRSGRATVVLASGELAEVTAERIDYSAETAHLFERAVAQGAVAGNAAAQPVELDAWATYNFEVEDLHTYVAEGARPGKRAAPLWPPGAPVRVRRARTGCLWQTVSDEPPEHKRTAESRCRCRTLPGGTGRERTEHAHSGSSLRPPNRRETTRNRRRWTGAMRWRMWSAA